MITRRDKMTPATISAGHYNTGYASAKLSLATSRLEARCFIFTYLPSAKRLHAPHRETSHGPSQLSLPQPCLLASNNGHPGYLLNATCEIKRYVNLLRNARGPSQSPHN
jgi:hypothetical protein